MGEERVGVGAGRRRQRWIDWAVVAGLLVLALAFYAPLTTSNRIAYDFDIWVFFYPLRQYAADALREGRFPLWNPDIFLGSPFYANAQTALLYPLNVVFLVLRCLRRIRCRSGCTPGWRARSPTCSPARA